MRNLDIIRISLQENITVNTSRCFLERGGKNLLFLCIDAPLFRSPREQAKSRHRINIQDNQLEGTNLLLLCRLSNQHAPEPEPIMMEHVPILVEEVKEGEAEAEEVVEDVIEEAERQEQEYEPYQLTHYYRNQLEQFELDYVRWEENQYHLCHQHFEEIMLEWYKRALGYLPLGEEEEEEIERFWRRRRWQQRNLNDVVEWRQEVIINNGHDENIIIDQDHEKNVIIYDDHEENIIIMNDREQN